MVTSLSRWLTIGDFLLRRLEEAGVGHLFGVPGDSTSSSYSNSTTVAR